MLEPYPSGIDIKTKYRIRYRYSNLTAKPNIVCIPKNYIIYDCILCSGNYDSNYLRVFTDTYITGNQKYIGFKKKTKKNYSKKVLLYLPTYGKESSIDLIADELKELQKDYYVIAKIHHGTSFLNNEKERIDKVKNNVDEYYDLHKDLSELLSIADVVLTDNSGSIFEAIYTEVPVAVFSGDINKNKKDGFDTIQYELYKQGILPYTNKIEGIKKVLKEAQSTSIKTKQRKWNRTNLFHPQDLKIDFVKVIEKYLKDDVNQRYYEMHNILKNDYYDLHKQINDLTYELNNEIETKKSLESKIFDKEGIITDLQKENKYNKEKIKFLEKQLNYYKTGKLYKIAHDIYQLKNGGKK